jgi:hypothetical protein
MSGCGTTGVRPGITGCWLRNILLWFAILCRKIPESYQADAGTSFLPVKPGIFTSLFLHDDHPAHRGHRESPPQSHLCAVFCRVNFCGNFQWVKQPVFRVILQWKKAKGECVFPVLYGTRFKKEGQLCGFLKTIPIFRVHSAWRLCGWGESGAETGPNLWRRDDPLMC